ncbi:MAG: MOSC domain-containing protein [Solirubrobacterales bacterium]
MAATVDWISFSPVKGMRLQELDEVEVDTDGLPGDRQFFLVNEKNVLLSVSRVGPLLEILPEYLSGPDSGTLSFLFPDGSTVSGTVELGHAEEVNFYGETLLTQPVLGDASAAISDHCGMDLRLMARPDDRPGVDRGNEGPVTLLGVAAIDRLEAAAAEAGQPGTIDRRRFRMNFGIKGIDSHEEDLWMGKEVDIGAVKVEVQERVGRCAATTRDPDRGNVDLKTLHHIRAYRADSDSPEPLPFGVYATVKQPGRIRVGDPVIPS